MVIHAIYASTSGNVEITVEAAIEVLRQQGFEVVLHRSEQTAIEVIQNNENFILASSTWEHGVLNHFFQPLYEAMKKIDLTGKKAAFIGLGDMRYEPVLFNQGIKILHKTWHELGGEQLGGMLLINGEPYHILDTKVKPWATEIAGLFKTGTTVAL